MPWNSVPHTTHCLLWSFRRYDASNAPTLERFSSPIDPPSKIVFNLDSCRITTSCQPVAGILVVFAWCYHLGVKAGSTLSLAVLRNVVMVLKRMLTSIAWPVYVAHVSLCRLRMAPCNRSSLSMMPIRDAISK